MRALLTRFKLFAHTMVSHYAETTDLEQETTNGSETAAQSQISVLAIVMMLPDVRQNFRE